MIKRIATLGVLAVCFAAGVAHAQPQSVDPRSLPQYEGVPKVDLYSFGVGPEIFEKFGHTALCLTYARNTRGDWPTICFNYGVTNFHDPAALVWGFMRAEQKFWVEPTPLSHMQRFYEAEDRDIFRQRLPLSDEEALQIADKLWFDIRPENRYYIYHHFKDNCTTRLRDMIDKATDARTPEPGGLLRKDSNDRVPLSFRGYGRRGMSEFTAIIGISDFITGRNLDYYPTVWESMFHPLELRDMVESRLGVTPEVIYKRRGPPFAESGPTRRWVIVLISILLTLPLVLVRLRGWKRERLAIAVAALPLMFWGVLLWLIFAFVTIDWVRWNEVMVMYVPTDLAIPWLSPKRRQRYAQVRVAMVAVASLLAAVGVFKQPIWVPVFVAFLPLAVLAFDLPPANVRVEAKPEPAKDEKRTTPKPKAKRATA